MIFKIIVWYNPKKNIYYYKKIKGYYADYYIGYENSYGHKIILIIDDLVVYTIKVPLKTCLINRLIRFLEKLK